MVVEEGLQGDETDEDSRTEAGVKKRMLEWIGVGYVVAGIGWKTFGRTV